jgi:hypothetical protein
MDLSLVDIEWADGEDGGLRNSVLEALFFDVFFDVAFDGAGVPVQGQAPSAATAAFASAVGPLVLRLGDCVLDAASSQVL